MHRASYPARVFETRIPNHHHHRKRKTMKLHQIKSSGIENPTTPGELAWVAADGALFESSVATLYVRDITATYDQLFRNLGTFVKKDDLRIANHYDPRRIGGMFRNALEVMAKANGYTLVHRSGRDGGWALVKNDPAAVAKMDRHYIRVAEGVTHSHQRSLAAR